MPPTLHHLPRPSLPHPQHLHHTAPQTRHFSASPHRRATLLRRPHRPYTFTQLLTLSDGSTFTHRTTSPLAVYKSNKDVRNTPLWNPSNVRMANIEEDEAGRLRAFRRRFGRGWDAQGEEGEGEKGEAGVVGEGSADEVQKDAQGEGRGGKDGEGGVVGDGAWSDEQEDNLMDLIGSYGLNAAEPAKAREARGGGGKKGKGKR